MLKGSIPYRDTLPVNRFSDLRRKQKEFFVIAVFIFVLIYAGIQIVSLFLPPKLELIYPEKQITATSNILEFSGYTEPTATVRINNNLVFPDKAGFFKKEVLLQNGINSFTIEAVNSFGRKTAQTVRVIYEEQLPEARK